MTSIFVKELIEFGERLGADGYPTALIERTAERMRAMEELIVASEELQRVVELEDAIRKHRDCFAAGDATAEDNELWEVLND